jgi:hypothetical protein
MQRYRLSLLLAVAVLLIGLPACDAGFEELNQNPNAPENVPPAFVLPRAQQTTADRLYSMSGMNGYIGGIWAQGIAKIQYTDEDRYDFSGRVALVNNLWTSFYAVTLEDLRQVAMMGEERGDPNITAIAEIMMAYNFQQITDLWGDVPYEEALLAAEEALPSYTPQAQIYAGLIRDLDRAIGMVTAGTPFGSADLVYQGNMDRWVRFANSLKLRIAMRMSETNEAAARSAIQAVLQDGRYFQSHADNAEFRYLQFPDNNPVHNFARTREDHKVSLTMITHLQELDDPRLRIYATPVRDEDLRDAGIMYQGVVNADVNNSLPLGEVSTMGHYFLAPESPARFMTYDEVLFILAEAAARGWIAADAEALYYDAIRAAMNLYSQDRIGPVLAGFAAGDQAFRHQGLRADETPSGIASAEIDAYLQQPEVQWNAAQWRQKIGLQKWLALYSEGFEQWTEWRRLGYPHLEPGPLAVLDEVPRRVPYPVIEQSLNRPNYQEAVSRQGADNMLTRVWWDPN